MRYRAYAAAACFAVFLTVFFYLFSRSCDAG